MLKAVRLLSAASVLNALGEISQTEQAELALLGADLLMKNAPTDGEHISLDSALEVGLLGAVFATTHGMPDKQVVYLDRWVAVASLYDPFSAATALWMQAYGSRASCHVVCARGCLIESHACWRLVSICAGYLACFVGF